MLRPTTLLVHTGNWTKLAQLAKARGVSAAVLVRLAIAEYVRREVAKEPDAR